MLNSTNMMEGDADNENQVLCEKIINDIQAVFQKEPNISTFEIFPDDANCNKSPVQHIEHHLCLKSWCAKHVYDHAHKTLIAYRRLHQHRFLQHSEVLTKYLNVALLINPDVTTFWHIRRQMVQTNHLKINREFKFSALVLTRKPKSNEAFAYRRWLYSFQSHDAIDWHGEIGICDRSADRSPCNYHAWSHRLWVLQNSFDLVKSEFILTEKFMRKHISDCSSYHYRHSLLQHAYELCYFDAEELPHLHFLQKLINYYQVEEVGSKEEILQTLLPNFEQSMLAEPRIKSFLYCCNVAAHDIFLCDEQKNVYNHHETIEYHRRASLRFIVVQCVRFLLGEKPVLYMPPHAGAIAGVQCQVAKV